MKNHIMFRSKETQNQHEVGVKKIIKSPNEIRSMIHHEIRRHQTITQSQLLVILSIISRRSPFVNEITKLLSIMRYNQWYKRKTRSITDLKYNHDTSKKKSSTLSNEYNQMNHTRTRDITEPRNTFSRQLPTAIRRIDPITSKHNQKNSRNTKESEEYSETSPFSSIVQVSTQTGFIVCLDITTIDHTLYRILPSITSFKTILNELRDEHSKCWNQHESKWEIA